MDFDYIKIFVTIALAVIGWLIAHKFTSMRDVRNKKRDLRLQYLIRAYNTLTCDISHRSLTPERALELEKIVAEIQLYGSQSQIDLAKKLVDEMVEGGEFQLDPLTNNLRDDLRGELELKAVDGNVRWLRISVNDIENNESENKDDSSNVVKVT